MIYAILVRRLIPFGFGFFTAVAAMGFFGSTDVVELEKSVPTVQHTGGSNSCRNRWRDRSWSEKKLPSVSDGDRLAITSKPRPVYTDEARLYNEEGSVVLKVEFLANGKIGKVEPVTTLEHGLTDSAIAAARLISFKPRKIDGEPVTVIRQVEYTFDIY